MVIIGLTISMHFQQFEDLEFLILFRRSMLPESSDPHKTALQSVQAFRIRRGLSRFYFIRIPNLDSTSVRTRVSRFWITAPLTSQRAANYILIKLSVYLSQLNLNIQVNSELQSWWMTQEIENQITQQCWPVHSEGFLTFQHFQI